MKLCYYFNKSCLSNLFIYKFQFNENYYYIYKLIELWIRPLGGETT